MTRRVLALGFTGREISKDEYEIVVTTAEEEIPDFENFEIIIMNVGVFFLSKEEGGVLSGPTLTVEGSVKMRLERAKEIEVIKSLEEGKIICFISKNASDELFERIMQKANVDYRGFNRDFTDLEIKRSEFTRFLRNYGIADLGYREDDVDDIICKVADSIVGFSKKFKAGNLVVVPSDPSLFPNKIEPFLSTLAESLISYSVRLADKPPEWTYEFEFCKESKIKNSIKDLKTKLEDEKQKLTKYTQLKSILWVGDNELVEKIREFLDEINLRTERDEIYEEDFWIVDDEENEEVIVEAKGKGKNITRPDISKLDEHRGAREKPDDFPALLIGNTFRNADSLSRKEIGVSPNVIEKAVRTNILLMRTVDLCCLYKLIEKGKINAEEFFNILKTEKGWLKVEEDYEIKTG